MRILVNGSNLNKGGGIQVGNSLISEFANHAEHEFLVVCASILYDSLKQNFSKYPASMKVVKSDSCGFKDKACRVFRINPLLNKLEKEFAPDVVFTIFGPSLWKPKAPHLCGFARPQNIYHESPFFRLLDWKVKIKRKGKEFLAMQSFRNDSDILASETDDVSTRLRSLLSGKKVYTVSNSCHEVFDDEVLQTYFRLPDFHGVTLLTVASSYPHKNLQIIPKVGQILGKKYPDFQFRFVVSVDSEEFHYTATNCPEWLLPIGQVRIENCPSLYKQSTFMFLPTLLECFSASYAEAMKTSTPIITSDLSFAHGLCQDAAVYVDTLNAEAVADAIYELSHDKEKQKQMIQAGKQRLATFLTPKQRADRYLEILQELFENRKINK